jgi:hypothetical protein
LRGIGLGEGPGLIDELVNLLADEVVACAAGLSWIPSLRTSSTIRAAARIAFATRADALAMMDSIAMTGLNVAGLTYGQTGHLTFASSVESWVIMVNKRLTAAATGRAGQDAEDSDSGHDPAAQARRALF